MSRWTAAWVAMACISGCNSSSSSPVTGCNVRYDCSAGQTCWTQDGQTYVCTNAGSLAAGSSCNPSGTAVECGPQTGCLGNAPAGACTTWCNANGTCPGDAGACTSVTDSNGVTVRYCI